LTIQEIISLCGARHPTGDDLAELLVKAVPKLKWAKEYALDWYENAILDLDKERVRDYIFNKHDFDDTVDIARIVKALKPYGAEQPPMYAKKK
jgi:hypothetical protein